MNPNVSFDKQIVNNVAPAVLLSTFLVKHEHVEEFLAGFRKQFCNYAKAARTHLGAIASRGTAYS